MNLNFEYTRTFERKYKRLRRKFASIENDLKEFIANFENGQGVDMGHGFFKYRLAIKSKNKGKSGGLRIITLEIVTSEISKDVTLLTVFDKTEQASISKDEILTILQNKRFL